MNKDLMEWRMQPKLKWETTPTTVNAFYLPRSNAIVLPQAFVQYAYYNLGLE
jgi:predicted metalloendopeptidase